MYIHNNTQSGFSLLELMAVLAIGSILAALALPSYRDLVKNNCLTTNTNNMVASFQQARSEAVKRKSTVTIRSSSGTTDWGTFGWGVFINEDRNGNGVLDPGEDYDGDGVLDSSALMRVVRLGCTNTIVGNNLIQRYYSTGFIDAVARFDLCDDRTGETGRRVVITITGRPHTRNFNCS